MTAKNDIQKEIGSALWFAGIQGKHISEGKIQIIRNGIKFTIVIEENTNKRIIHPIELDHSLTTEKKQRNI